uniref:FlgD Ig-like domain-containing protein n=1 Tax=candidate division WOR-3 bacterium TaxID=2052148 RepID=A0A7C6EAJ7_UNCW3
MKINLQRILKLLEPNWFIIGIISLFWLIIRSGTKPSRITYPCQRVAANNSFFFLGGIAFPYLLRRIKPIRLKVKWHYILVSLFALLLIIFINYLKIKKPSPTAISNLATIHSWDGTDSSGKQLPNGTYLIRLESEIGSIEKKVILKRD